MKCNVGKTDKIIRGVIAVVFVAIGYMYQTTLGNWSWLFYALAVVLLITILNSFCLPYKLLGINTCKRRR